MVEVVSQLCALLDCAWKSVKITFARLAAPRCSLCLACVTRPLQVAELANALYITDNAPNVAGLILAGLVSVDCLSARIVIVSSIDAVSTCLAVAALLYYSALSHHLLCPHRFDTG